MKIDKKILWIVYAACAMEIDVNIFMKIITYGEYQKIAQPAFQFLFSSLQFPP